MNQQNQRQGRAQDAKMSHSNTQKNIALAQQKSQNIKQPSNLDEKKAVDDSFNTKQINQNNKQKVNNLQNQDIKANKNIKTQQSIINSQNKLHQSNISIEDDNKNDENIQKVSIIPLKSASKLEIKYKQRKNNEQTSQASNNQHRRKLSSALQKNSTELKEKEKTGNDSCILEQNTRLKSKNSFLIKQFKKIEEKLNKQLMKRGGLIQLGQSRKNRVNSVENISSRQILNADKRCKIYLKEIQTLKHKISFFSEQKVNELIGKIKELQQTNLFYDNQLRESKKKIKNYEKIINQIDDGNYIKCKQQNQKLKNQLKKIRQKLKKQQQEGRIQKLSASNQKAKTKKIAQKKEEEKKKQQQKQQKQITFLKKKEQRDNRQIKALSAQNNMQKQKIQKYQKQLQAKNRQIQALKHKLSTISRRHIKNKQSQSKNKQYTEKQIKSKSPIKQQNVNKNEQNKQTSNKHTDNNAGDSNKQKLHQEDEIQKKNQNNKQTGKQEKQEKQANIQRKTQNKQTKNKNFNQISVKKYPKKMQKGECNQLSLKWNHLVFSSKIKEIQIMPHQNGHVKCINARYQKGQPSKIQNGNYASFVCEQNGGQFVKQIAGGFKNGILQYLKITSNKKKQSKYCRHEIEQQCQNFVFGMEANQYPTALFGQNLNQSIIKLGCFVQNLSTTDKNH